MRKITQEAINNFMSSTYKDWFRNNTSVIKTHSSLYSYTTLHLFGNSIANRIVDNLGIEKIEICDGGGWVSKTTKERLNGIPGVNLRIKNYKWILNGKEWDGSWITI